MALVEEALKSYLVTSTGINARVSGRVYPSDSIPQGTLDTDDGPLECLTYQKNGGTPNGHQGGSGAMEDVNFTLTAYAKTAKAAAEIMELVRLRCDSKRGTIGDSPTQVTARIMRMSDPRAVAETPQATDVLCFKEIKNLRIVYVSPVATLN